MDIKDYPARLINLVKPENHQPLEAMKCTYAGPEYWNPAPKEDCENLGLHAAFTPIDNPVGFADIPSQPMPTDPSDEAFVICKTCKAKVSAKLRFCPECGSTLAHE